MEQMSNNISPSLPETSMQGRESAKGEVAGRSAASVEEELTIVEVPKNQEGVREGVAAWKRWKKVCLGRGKKTRGGGEDHKPRCGRINQNTEKLAPV